MTSRCQCAIDLYSMLGQAIAGRVDDLNQEALTLLKKNLIPKAQCASRAADELDLFARTIIGPTYRSFNTKGNWPQCEVNHDSDNSR